MVDRRVLQRSSAAFLVALSHASVASVLFMQALAPILAAVLGTALGDPVQRRTLVATRQLDVVEPPTS